MAAPDPSQGDDADDWQPEDDELVERNDELSEATDVEPGEVHPDHPRATGHASSDVVSTDPG